MATPRKFEKRQIPTKVDVKNKSAKRRPVKATLPRAQSTPSTDLPAEQPERTTTFTGLHSQAVELLRVTKQDVAAMPVKDVQQVVHELQVRQIELEIKNEDLRRTQVEIEAAKDRYKDRYAVLYDFSPAGHLTLDTSSMIVEANLRAATLLGINRQELIGQSVARFITPDSCLVFYRHCHDVLKSGTRQTCEVQLLKESGPSCWVYLESVAMPEESGRITRWRTAMLDMSSWKRAEETLRLAKFSVERAADAVYWVDSQAKILDVKRHAAC